MVLNKIVKKYRGMPVQAKASLWFLICSFLQKGISVVTTPIFTRLLSTSEYGKFNVYNSWLGIITIIVSLNLYAGVYTQGLVKFDDKERFSSSLQGLTTTLVCIWTVLYVLFHSFWNRVFSLSTVQMLSMFIMIWTTAAFSFWAAEQRVKYSYKSLVAITILISLAKPILGIILVINAQDKVTARIIGLTLVEVLGYTWLFISQMKKGKTFYDKKYWKYALCFNIPLVPHYLSQIILNNSDRLMINSLVGAGEAGIYSLAYSISLIMTLFNTALLQTIQPWVYQKLKAGRAQDISKVAYPSLLFIAVVNLALIIFAPEAVFLFAPSEYQDAIWVIPPVAMSVFFNFAYSFFATFEFYYGKTKFIMFASVGGAVLNIVLNGIFIPLFGYYAAGYTTLACFIIYAACHYYFMSIICNQELGGIKVYNTRLLLLMSGVFMLLGFIIMLTYKHTIIRHIFALIIISVLAINYKRIIQYIKQTILLRKHS